MQHPTENVRQYACQATGREFSKIHGRVTAAPWLRSQGFFSRKIVGSVGFSLKWIRVSPLRIHLD
jgi:hypothetical protein